MPIVKVKGGWLPFAGSKIQPVSKKKAQQILKAIKASQAKKRS